MLNTILGLEELTRAKRISARKQYVNVKVPVELAGEVDKIPDKKLLGHRSRAEFVMARSERSLFKSRSDSPFFS
jgi:hypothetical protein